MLVWTASYPRSGSTLLRQVLKACFGLDVYEAADGPDLWAPMGLDEYIGNLRVRGTPNAFVKQARASADLVLLKTHALPSADDDAVYIVRDGRLVLESYDAFQNTYHPGTTSFLSLLFGDDEYTDWTGHYQAWMGRSRGRTLLVRFEELVTPSPELLQRMADFLGHRGPIVPFVNPQRTLQQANPKFFRSGLAHWQPGPFWTEERLRLFYALHGPLMASLGYVDPAVLEGPETGRTADEEKGATELLAFTQELARRGARFRADLGAKEAVIHELHAAAEERLRAIFEKEAACARFQADLRAKEAVIRAFHATAEERLRAIFEKEAAGVRFQADLRAKEAVIRELQATAEERLRALVEKEAIIRELHAAAEERLALIPSGPPQGTRSCA